MTGYAGTRRKHDSIVRIQRFDEDTVDRLADAPQRRCLVDRNP
jgi:hypothetical protein